MIENEDEALTEHFGKFVKKVQNTKILEKPDKIFGIINEKFM
jgi:hypothetical protein